MLRPQILAAIPRRPLGYFSTKAKCYLRTNRLSHVILCRRDLQERIHIAGKRNNVTIGIFLLNGFEDLYQRTRLTAHRGHAVVATGLCRVNMRPRDTCQTTSETKVVGSGKEHEVLAEGANGVVFLLDICIRVTGQETRNARVRRTASMFSFAPIGTQISTFPLRDFVRHLIRETRGTHRFFIYVPSPMLRVSQNSDGNEHISTCTDPLHARVSIFGVCCPQQCKRILKCKVAFFQ